MNSASLVHRIRQCAALLLAAASLFVAANVAAQTATTGVIKGKMTDKATREGLVGVNVVVKGTYYGASTNPDGEYTIARVNPGTYVVQATLIGYKTVQFGSVKVEAGKVTQLSSEMEETSLTLGQEVVVVGQKPMFDIGETSSKRAVGAEEIQVAGVRDVKDIVSMQVGVVKSDDQIYIRGSRGYENAYLIDGVSVQDPLAGTGFGMQLPPGAIQEVEVITGGYNAEYGQATSGVVSFTTKEGSDKYSGSIGHKRDHFGFNDNTASNFNTDIWDAYLSGPEPITSSLLPLAGIQIPGKISFFGTFNMNITDGYTRWVEKIDAYGKPIGTELKAPGGLYSTIFEGTTFGPRRANLYSAMGKLTWRFTPTMRVSYSFSQSVNISQNTQTIQTTLEHSEPQPGYQFSFQNIPDSANTFTQINVQQTILWSHTISPKTFYEVRLSRYTAHVRGDANGKNWDQYREPKDVVTFPIVYYNRGTDTVGVIPGDGLYDIGNPSVWRDHYVDEFTIKFDITSHFTEKNKFKSGAELRLQELQMVDVVSPWVRPFGINNDVYRVNPAMGALYAQDGITFGGMILNFGMRFDFWVPGKYVDNAVKDSVNSMVSKGIRDQYLQDTYEAFGYHWKGRISPRLAIAHPVSDNQTLFFSYGHFSKFPRPQYVYSKLLRTNARSSFQTVGNPNLNPETTVAYELGLRNQLDENNILNITAFYKDIFDYITSKSVLSQATRYSSGSYTTYVNLDYARTRGIEVEYKMRHSDWFRGTFSCSYSIATGKSSATDEALYNVQQGVEEQIKERSLAWDRPVQGSLVLNFKIPKNKPLFDFGAGILDDINIYTRMFYQSGRRYTPYVFYGYESGTGRPMYTSDLNNPNGALGKDIFNVDLNFEKYIQAGPIGIVLTLEITNLLDLKNAQILNPVTGDAYEYTTDGKATPVPYSWNDPHYPDLQAPVSAYPYNPARYMAPRNFRAGMAVRF